MRLPHEDLRVKKTEKALRIALTNLILQKGYDAITVQDIVNEAEIARVTFYRHYRDKNELLGVCLDEVYLSLTASLTQLSLQDFKIEEPPITIFYQHVADNRNLYRAIFRSQGSFSAQSRIRDYLMKLIQKEIKTLLPRQSFPVPVNLIALHVASAELGMVMWWIENHNVYSPHYIAQVSHWLNLVGLLRSLDVSEDIIALLPKPTK